MIRALLVLVVLAARADARMMAHYDLTGLVLASDAVLIAERTVGKPSHFHVVKTLRGVAPAADLDLDDQLYQAPDRAFDKRVYVFVARRDAAPYIVPSGLRVVEGGKVFRFEQWNNPGGWTPVAQGSDPSDQWRGDGVPIDVAEFERELAAAFTRADAFLAAKPDRHLLALLPPAGDAQAQGGFYVDELGRRTQTLLAKAGDLEGALMAVARDHSAVGFGRDIGGAAALVAFAADPAKPVALRVTAIHAIEQSMTFFSDPPTMHALLALTADPSPRVRAIAIGVASQAFDWQSSDATQQRGIAKLRDEVRTALGKLYATERANVVLHAIAVAYERAQLHLPARADKVAFAASVVLARGSFQVDVACLTATVAKPSRIVGTRDGQPWTPPASNITVRCGEGLGGGISAPLAPGAYALSVELLVGKTAIRVPLGGMAVDPSGEVALVPE
jgi:hypothetical protein